MRTETIFLGIATDNDGREYRVWNVNAVCDCGASMTATVPLAGTDDAPRVLFRHNRDGSHTPDFIGTRAVEVARTSEVLPDGPVN